MVAEPSLARRDRRALRPRARRRVPGHQPAAGVDPARAEARRARASRSSATTRSRSIRSAPRRCATSSTSRRSSTPPARVVTLERNYRSTQPILDASNAVIDLARRALHQEPVDRARLVRRSRASSPCRDEAEQARCVAERVLEQREQGMALKSQAVLFRASQPQRAARDRARAARHPVREVRRAQVPRSGAREGRAGGAALGRESAQPRWPAFAPRSLVPGVGPATANALLDAIEASPTASPALEAFELAAVGRGGLDRRSSTCSARCARRRRLAGRDRRASRRWYEPHLERLYDDAAVRQRGSRAARADRGDATPSRERFLTELTLDPPDATSDEAGAPAQDDDYLILSTIHSAKGQEWKAVHVLNVVDGCIPSDMATGTHRGDRGGAAPALRRDDAGEGRPAVARPAALLCPPAGGYGDRHVYASRSRFIPDALAPALRVRRVAARGLRGRVARAQHLPDPPIDVAARIRQSWG